MDLGRMLAYIQKEPGICSLKTTLYNLAQKVDQKCPICYTVIIVNKKELK